MKPSYNMAFHDEESERKLLDVIELERAQFKKRDHANKEIISEISKKLKINEKKMGEESKATSELKKQN